MIVGFAFSAMVLGLFLMGSSKIVISVMGKDIERDYMKQKKYIFYFGCIFVIIVFLILFFNTRSYVAMIDDLNQQKLELVKKNYILKAEKDIKILEIKKIKENLNDCMSQQKKG